MTCQSSKCSCAIFEVNGESFVIKEREMKSFTSYSTYGVNWTRDQLDDAVVTPINDNFEDQASGLRALKSFAVLLIDDFC